MKWTASLRVAPCRRFSPVVGFFPCRVRPEAFPGGVSAGGTCENDGFGAARTPAWTRPTGQTPGTSAGKSQPRRMQRFPLIHNSCCMGSCSPRKTDGCPRLPPGRMKCCRPGCWPRRSRCPSGREGALAAAGRTSRAGGRSFEP